MKNFLKVTLSLLGVWSMTSWNASAQSVDAQQPWSVRVAQSEMVRCPQAWQLDFQPRLKWDYCHGVELQAFLNLYDAYGDQRYFDYARQYCDTMTLADGSVQTYRPSELSLDRINTGKIFFRMYEQTKEEKYRLALDNFRAQLVAQPRTKEGGFWHKQVYPNQMWLDGIYMASPFYAEYAYRNNRPRDYQDVIRQFVVVARHTYDPATGLYRHAWDEKHEQPWADKTTGQSAHTWGRAMGWFSMALVDALEFIPTHEEGRDSVMAILQNVAAQIQKWQEPKSGLWYQVIDCSGREGNYLESSASAMFIYTLYKGVRLGYLDPAYLEVAEKGYEGFLKEFIEVDAQGVVSITKACAVAGLGGTPYRSGDYDYYIHEKIRANDPKAVGPFINASLEKERLDRQRAACPLTKSNSKQKNKK
jgi:unsaturated rhamnogalacturonyl hydrolase